MKGERGRCLKCGYDLRGLPGDTTVCPECGMDQTRWMAGVARRRARVRCLHQWMGWLMMGCAGLVMLAGLMERPFGQSRDLAALMGFGGVGMAWVVLTIWPVLAGAEYLRWPRDRWMAARLIGLAGVMIALVALGLVALM